MNDLKVISLDSLSELLPASDPVADQVRILVRKIQAVNHVISDLSELFKYLDEARLLIASGKVFYTSANQPASQEQSSSILLRALTQAATITYFRAFDGGADGRLNTPFKEAFVTDELMEAHNRILSTRHNVFAHFGNEPALSEPWTMDRVVLVEDDNQEFAVFYTHGRRTATGQALADLYSCAYSAKGYLDDHQGKTEAKLLSKLGNISRRSLMRDALGSLQPFEALFSKNGTALVLHESLMRVPRKWVRLQT